MTDKQKFLKEVTIISDTREQENAHILNDLNGWGVKHISRKIPLGDYSFICNDKEISAMKRIQAADILLKYIQTK